VRNIHPDQNMPQFDPAETILAAATMVCDALKHRFEEPVRDLAHIRVPIVPLLWLVDERETVELPPASKIVLARQLVREIAPARHRRRRGRSRPAGARKGWFA